MLGRRDVSHKFCRCFSNSSEGILFDLLYFYVLDNHGAESFTNEEANGSKTFMLVCLRSFQDRNSQWGADRRWRFAYRRLLS